MPLHINEQAMLIDTPVEFCKESPESYYIVTDRKVTHIGQLDILGYSRYSALECIRDAYWRERERALKLPRCGMSEVFEFSEKVINALILKHFEKL